jgi:hypothetical protein
MCATRTATSSSCAPIPITRARTATRDPLHHHPHRHPARGRGACRAVRRGPDQLRPLPRLLHRRRHRRGGGGDRGRPGGGTEMYSPRAAVWRAFRRNPTATAIRPRMRRCWSSVPKKRSWRWARSEGWRALRLSRGLHDVRRVPGSRTLSCFELMTPGDGPGIPRLCPAPAVMIRMP